MTKTSYIMTREKRVYQLNLQCANLVNLNKININKIDILMDPFLNQKFTEYLNQIDDMFLIGKDQCGFYNLFLCFLETKINDHEILNRIASFIRLNLPLI